MSKLYIDPNNGNRHWFNDKNQSHRLDGPASIFYAASGGWASRSNPIIEYCICDKYYYNFIEYIQAVIKYKKNNEQKRP